MTLQCKLSILLRMDSFAFMVSDQGMNLQMLREFTLPTDAMLHTGMALDELQVVFRREPLLHASYDRVVAGVVSPLHTLIPRSLYQKGHDREYLAQLAHLDEGMTCLSDFLPELDVYNVYAYPSAILDMLQHAFPDAPHRHFASPFLQAMRHYREEEKDPCLFLHIWDSYVLTVLFTGRELTFSNMFPYRHPQDVLYYLLLACRQAEREPEAMAIRLSGALDEDSTLYRELCRLSEDMEWLGLPPGLPDDLEGDLDKLAGFTDLYVLQADNSRSEPTQA